MHALGGASIAVAIVAMVPIVLQWLNLLVSHPWFGHILEPGLRVWNALAYAPAIAWLTGVFPTLGGIAALALGIEACGARERLGRGAVIAAVLVMLVGVAALASGAPSGAIATLQAADIPAPHPLWMP